jgi:transposase
LANTKTQHREKTQCASSGLTNNAPYKPALAKVRVIRHIRPKLSCRCCERIIQAPAPDLPIEKGRPGPGLVADVVVNKYLDGLPLYRQSAILAREGIEIERATRAA